MQLISQDNLVIELNFRTFEQTIKCRSKNDQFRINEIVQLKEQFH